MQKREVGDSKEGYDVREKFHRKWLISAWSCRRTQDCLDPRQGARLSYIVGKVAPGPKEKSSKEQCAEKVKRDPKRLGQSTDIVCYSRFSYFILKTIPWDCEGWYKVFRSVERCIPAFWHVGARTFLEIQFFPQLKEDSPFLSMLLHL